MSEQFNPQGTFVPAKCPACGGEFPVDPAQECTVCKYCQQPVITANAIQNYQMNHRSDGAAFTGAAPIPPQEPPKKRRTWLWVLGWIFCFPIPLTILMLRSKTMNPKIKYGVIAAGWIVYLLIVLIPRNGSNKSTEQPPVEQQTPAVTETVREESSAVSTTAKPAVTTAPPETEADPETTEPEITEPAETTAPEPSASEIQQMIQNGDYSLVTPEFKATMDAYEAFYDEYIAFMKKYKSGQGDIMGMMNDYMTMLSKTEEWSKTIDAIDEKKLSVADDAYFLLVTLRVEKKLLSVV